MTAYSDIVEAHREAIKDLQQNASPTLQFTRRIVEALCRYMEWPDDDWNPTFDLDADDPTSIKVCVDVRLADAAFGGEKRDSVDLVLHIRAQRDGYDIACADVHSTLTDAPGATWDKFFAFVSSNLRNIVRNMYL